MNNLPPGLALGGITGVTIILADILAGSQITVTTVKDIMPVMATVTAAVWWAGRKFQNIENGLDELKSLKKEVEEIKKHISSCPSAALKIPTTHHYGS